ncbi:MAG: translation elongation factor Ts [Bryobacteraceae bacterium]
MAEINAQLVKQLRERTGAGMMECKSALVETNGDMDNAEVVLRKKGIASAGKKSSRSTKQGLIGAHISTDSKLGVLVEVNCESDFVARTDEFQTLTADVAHHIAETKPKHVRLEDVTVAERANIKSHLVLYEQKFTKDQSVTVAEVVKTKIAKLGENIAVSRFTIFEVAGHGTIAHYIHTGAQIGVLVEVHTASDLSKNGDFQALVRDLAMQVAAANPQCVSKEDVPPAALAKERDIQKDRVIKEGKPANVADKIVEGRLSKFYEEVCLLEQPFIKENSVSVRELLKSKAGALGDVKIARFVRYKVGDAGDAPGVEASPLPITA